MSRKGQDIADAIAAMHKEEFTNEHGEKFELYSNGHFVLMSGDEVRAMTDPKNHVSENTIGLFSEHFNVWSPLELYQLGQAISLLGEHYMTIGDYETLESMTDSST
jgi:hypothetical protein